MSDRNYTDEQVAEARRLNRMVERDWDDRQARGLPPATRAEDAYRIEKRRNGNL